MVILYYNNYNKYIYIYIITIYGYVSSHWVPQVFNFDSYLSKAIIDGGFKPTN